MTFFSKSKGVTVFELVIVVAVLLILATILIIVIKPGILFSETRDKKRISDVSTLERIIVEHLVDTQSYPGTANTTYFSDTLPTGGTDLSNVSSGWLGVNSTLAQYYPKLPLDPNNNTTYRYIYRHNGTSYEINVRLESDTQSMTNDGGNSSNFYEIGNDLTLL
jgi:type II secretory pathway pseudopilin PulG